MSKKAFLVGINQYLCGQNLAGCVADVQNMSAVLTDAFGFRAADVRLTDQSATKANVMDRLHWLIDGAQPGDVLVFHYSGHGAQVVDRNGDELSDHKDEILCMTDMDFRNPGTYIVDDELGAVCGSVRPGVRLVVIADSCHSGTITRDFNPDAAPQRRRSLAPPADIAYRFESQHSRFGGVPTRRMFRGLRASAELGYVVLAGCRDDQTSADAEIDGKPCGAFTHALCAAINTSGGDVSYADWMTRARRVLRAGGYSQTPQLSGTDRLVAEHAFTPVSASATRVIRRVVEARPVAAFTMGGKSIAAPVVTQQVLAASRGIGAGMTDSDTLAACALAQLEWVESRQLPAPAAGARGLRAQAPVTVTVSADDTSAYVALENRDGVYIWHGPDQEQPASRGLRRRGMSSRRSPSKRAVTFTIRPGAAAPTMLGGQRGFFSALGGVLHILKWPVVAAEKFVLHTIESTLHPQKLWYYTGNSFDAGQLFEHADVNTMLAGRLKAVLFIHGFISSVAGGFKGLNGTTFLHDLAQSHLILGFDNLTLSQDPFDNAAAIVPLLQRLPSNVELSVVAHSRGGLVARALYQSVPYKRLVTFGSPLQGTSLANDLFRALSLVTNATAAGGVMMSLCIAAVKGLASGDALPGAKAMRPGSDCIRRLDGVPQAPIDCAISNFDPASGDGFWLKVFNALADTALFPGPNDLVVDTPFMVPDATIGGPESPLPYVPSDDVDHFRYFEQDRTQRFLANLLG